MTTRPTKTVILEYNGLQVGESKPLHTDEGVERAIEQIYEKLSFKKGWHWKKGITDLGNLYRIGTHRKLSSMKIIVGEKI